MSKRHTVTKNEIDKYRMVFGLTEDEVEEKLDKTVGNPPTDESYALAVIFMQDQLIRQLKNLIRIKDDIILAEN